MSLLLLRPSKGSAPPRLRGRWGVRKLAYLVPRGEKHTKAWWLKHFDENWDA